MYNPTELDRIERFITEKAIAPAKVYGDSLTVYIISGTDDRNIELRFSTTTPLMDIVDRSAAAINALAGA